MKRTLFRIGLGLVGLVAVGLALTWAGPDLLAALRSWRGPWEASSQAPEGPAAGGETAADEPKIEWFEDGWCRPHGKPEADCENCLQEPGKLKDCVEKLPVIRLKGPDVAERIGLETVPVESREYADTISGNAEVTYDEHLYAEVVPRVGGVVRDVDADHGRKVKTGDMLCVIDSAEVGTAKAQYLAALPLVKLAEATLKRTQELTRANALPLKDELEAKTALNRAQADLLNASQRLHNLGFTDKDLSKIERDQDTSTLLRIDSPIDGTVVERHLVTGEAVSANQKLVLVTDLRVMWAWIDIYEAEISRVHTGQRVTLTVSGLENQVFEGRVHFIDAAVNRATRTIRVVAEMDNPDGQLRSNQFGRAEIVVGQPRQVTLVPTEAIQRLDGAEVVFLPQPDGSFHPQRVVTGIEIAPGLREIRWGVQPGQKVVTTGSFLLKSEVVRMTEGLGGE